MKSPRRAATFRIEVNMLGWFVLVGKEGHVRAGFNNDYFTRREVEAIVKRIEEKRTK